MCDGREGHCHLWADRPDAQGGSPIDTPDPDGRRLVLCDDHRLMAQGLRGLLEPPHVVTAVAYSGADLMSILKVTPADCLLLDISMPDRNGVDLLPDIRTTRPGLKILVVTMHVNRYLANSCLERGAHGFVPKTADRAEVLQAISVVLRGGRYLSASMPDTSHSVGLGARHPGLENLTPRQHEIIHLLGEAKRPLAIARALSLSACTITGHLKIIQRKLGVSSESELIRLAVALSMGYSQPPAATVLGDVPPSGRRYDAR